MAPTPDISVFRPDRPGIRKVLGDLEAEIMDLVWSRPPCDGAAVRDVHVLLYERRRLAYTTVMTTMARLASKNLLRVEKAGHAYIYYPNFTEQELISRVVGQVLDKLLLGLTDATPEDPSVTERIHRLLDEIARRRAIEEGE